MSQVAISWISYGLCRSADEATGAMSIQGWGGRTEGIQGMWGCPLQLLAKSLASGLDNREHNMIIAHMIIWLHT